MQGTPTALDTVNALATVLFAVSLGVERLLSIIKSTFPWLTEEKKTAAGEVDLKGDRPRRIIVQLLALVASWATCWLVFGKPNPIGTQEVGGAHVPIGVLAFLGSGGSALWNNVIAYTKGLKDQQKVAVAADTLDYHQTSESVGVVALDSGATGRVPAQDQVVRNAIQKLRDESKPAATLQDHRANAARRAIQQPLPGGDA